MPAWWPSCAPASTRWHMARQKSCSSTAAIRWPWKRCSLQRRANFRRCRQREWWPDVTPVPTDTVSASEVIARESAHVVQTYRRAPIVIARGRGAYLYDVDGREYLDLISGVGVASLGHANPELARIVAEQATELLHCSNLFFHPYQGALAERLATLSGLPRTFFCNSGTEAVEACLKFARRFWFTGGDQTKKGIVALHGSFHGRTMG